MGDWFIFLLNNSFDEILSIHSQRKGLSEESFLQVSTRHYIPREPYTPPESGENVLPDPAYIETAPEAVLMAFFPPNLYTGQILCSFLHAPYNPA